MDNHYSEQNPTLSKEFLQKKHYLYFKELQNFSSELPTTYQQRLPYELLSNLANSLLDETLFEIVRGLKEIQQMTERQLIERRMKMINTHKELRNELSKKHREQLSEENVNLPHVTAAVLGRQEKEREDLEKYLEDTETRLDMKIVMELDQTVSDQQVTLHKAGVPGFYVSNNPNDIRIMMYLLDFINRLQNKEMTDF